VCPRSLKYSRKVSRTLTALHSGAAAVEDILVKSGEVVQKKEVEGVVNRGARALNLQVV